MCYARSMPLYRTPTEPELDRVADGVALAGRLVGSEGLPSAAKLQALYDVLLQDPNGTEAAIEALGYAFGSLIIQQDWLHWARAGPPGGSRVGWRGRYARSPPGTVTGGPTAHPPDARPFMELEMISSRVSIATSLVDLNLMQ